MENKAFKNKTEWYYNLYKPGIASLVREGPNKILDLGCATGVLGRKLKEMNKAEEIIGVEIFPQAADEAARFYEMVYSGDIEHIKLDYHNYFDYVICADILEHLIDPWEMLRNIYLWLKMDGYVIVSLPNLRYWRVLIDLLLRGRWEYKEAGVLDNTHLRFFTRKSFLKILSAVGFAIEYTRLDVNGVKQKIFNSVTFAQFEEFMGSQLIIVGKK